MTRRKGELTIQRIKRLWPYSVVVPREVFDCSIRFQAAYSSIAPRHEAVLVNGRQFVRAYFTDAAEAEVFARRAGCGSTMPTGDLYSACTDARKVASRTVAGYAIPER